MTKLTVDGHVHFHPQYDLGRFFRRAGQVAQSEGAPTMLWFVENAGDHAFRALRDGQLGAPGVHIEGTEDPAALAASVDEGPPTFVVGGRQVITRENLEVLFVGVPPEHELTRVARGEERAADLLACGLEEGFYAGLPWGFGKWLGGRGRHVAELAQRERFRTHRRFFFGDILARCWPWPRPAVFDAGPLLLPGTDVLPLSGFEDRILSYGFQVEGNFEASRPWDSVADWLDHRAPVQVFGAPDSTVRALSAQVAYRFRKKGAA